MASNSLSSVIQALGSHRVKRDEPLSQHTYFKIGGPADAFFESQSSDDLVLAVQTAIKLNMPYFILGGGSNILVGDKGIRGLVIKNRADVIRTAGFQGKVAKRQTPQINQAVIKVDSGTLLNRLVRYTIEESLAGLEVFLSVPGTVGGAIYNNSHYQPEQDEFIGNLLYQATLIDSLGEVKLVDRNYFKFNYDYSILHQTQETIINASFALKGSDRDSLWSKATELIKRRNLRQPIGIACSGCTFRNISRPEALRLGTPKLNQSAGYLIDQIGLKGLKLGRVRVSPVHAAFIENLGGASAREVLRLIDTIKTQVFNKFSVKLDLEIFLVGEF